jgi:glycosyltransferase involved in cell wall biosynthesis
VIAKDPIKAPDRSVQTPEVLLVHDYLLVMRGAERTFEAMTACYPDAEIATLLYDPVRTDGRFLNRRLRTSFLQPFAADQGRFRRCLPMLPLAAERLPVKDARVVISSSSAFAHGIRPAPDAVHISYCHSPFRYVWHERDRTVSSVPAIARPAARGALGALRRWDVRAAGRVDMFVANSELTRQRIGDYYGRESVVVHPPVDLDRFTGRCDPREHFLMVGEVTKHKNSEIALAAAERAGLKIQVVGSGPDLPRLRRRYRNAEFLGRVDDRTLAELYATCRALVVPAVEEFGITMVEAQASGRPVVAAAAGGALEIVADGVTGILVKPRSIDELADAMHTTDWESFDAPGLRANARRFSSTRFADGLMSVVSAMIGQTATVGPGPLAADRRSTHPSTLKAADALAALSMVGGSLARTRHRS